LEAEELARPRTKAKLRADAKPKTKLTKQNGLLLNLIFVFKMLFQDVTS